MKHAHRGPRDMACVGCYQEAEERLADEEKRRDRLFAWLLVAGSVLLAIGAALVLWKIGRMG